MASRGQEMNNTEADRITVYWGTEKLSPVQYNSFEHGGFHYTTTIQESETPEEAFTRAWNFLDKMARKTYAKKIASFKDNIGKAQKVFG